jgi:hypothetical protein
MLHVGIFFSPENTKQNIYKSLNKNLFNQDIQTFGKFETFLKLPGNTNHFMGLYIIFCNISLDLKDS